MSISKLSEKIKTTYKSPGIISMWHSVYPILKANYVVINNTGKVTLVDGRKYQGDLEGLFKNVLRIKEEFILPTMLVNGYNNSQDYDGTQLEFLLLNENILNRYLLSRVRSIRLLSK